MVCVSHFDQEDSSIDFIDLFFMCFFSLCSGVYLFAKVKTSSLCFCGISGFNSLHLKFRWRNELFGVLQAAQYASDYFEV